MVVTRTFSSTGKYRIIGGTSPKSRTNIQHRRPFHNLTATNVKLEETLLIAVGVSAKTYAAEKKYMPWVKG